MARYPDLICLGAQKAATTWLDGRLRRDPGVFLPPVKELHYFSSLYNGDARNYGPAHRKAQSRSVIDWIDGLDAPAPDQLSRRAQARHIAEPQVDDDWYSQVFSPARPDQLCAEICPSYLNMPDEAVDHVLRLNPDVRLLVIVGDPVDRTWSHIRMHMSRGTESRDTGRFLTGEASLAGYLFYTDYAASLPRWQSKAAPDRLLLILHDRVESDPQAALDEIYEFVGLPVPEEDQKLHGKVHVGEAIDIPPALRARLLEDLAPQYDFLRREFPDAVEGWLARHRDALGGPPDTG